MKIIAEGYTYSGTPSEIVDQLADLHWDDAVRRAGTEQTLRRFMFAYEQVSGRALEYAPNDPLDTRAALLFHAMQELELLEIVEDE